MYVIFFYKLSFSDTTQHFQTRLEVNHQKFIIIQNFFGRKNITVWIISIIDSQYTILFACSVEVGIYHPESLKCFYLYIEQQRNIVLYALLNKNYFLR